MADPKTAEATEKKGLLSRLMRAARKFMVYVVACAIILGLMLGGFLAALRVLWFACSWEWHFLCVLLPT